MRRRVALARAMTARRIADGGGRFGAVTSASAADRHDRIIDAGELNGRVFFNSAGVGFDAHVAAAFATSAGHARGFASYASVTLRELFRYEPGEYVISAEGQPPRTCRALLISVANTRQWGSGARIAPAALMDDERLDLVIVPAMPPVVVLANTWRLFAGSIGGWSAVETQRIHAAAIRCTPPAPVHVDGEPAGRLGSIDIRVIPAAPARALAALTLNRPRPPPVRRTEGRRFVRHLRRGRLRMVDQAVQADAEEPHRARAGLGPIEQRHRPLRQAAGVARGWQPRVASRDGGEVVRT